MCTMKRSAIFILIFTIFLTTIPIAQAAIVNSASLSDLQIFPEDHIWNIPVNTLPVDARSAEYIKAMNSSGHLRENTGFPYNVVSETQKKSTITFGNPSISDNVPYPIPSNPLIEGAGSVESCTEDCHVLIVNKDTHFLYELFDVHKNPDGSWNAASGAVCNLSNYTLRGKWKATPDASGLAMLPGLLRYEEVEAGEIKHAIRFTTPRTQDKYVWPAISGGTYSNIAYPPMGQRFRLKASFDTSGYPNQTQIILEALKTYGMILADSGPEWWISGTPDSRWDTNALLALRNVKGSDFEAVNSTSLMINESSGKAWVASLDASKPAILVTTPYGGESWVRGTKPSIIWKSSGSTGSYVKIELLKAGIVVRIIASGTPNDGSFDTWTVDNGLVTGSDYRIRITSNTNPAISDTSNSNFSISGSIVVTSPNGGESFSATTIPITWTSSGNVGSYVRIELFKAGALVQTLASGTPNDGAFSWTIPSGLATGNDFRIRITSTTNPAISDTSNSNFTIGGSIIATSPNGGEIFRGTTLPITWTSSGNVGSYVKIDLLKAGTVLTLASGTPNDGSFSWTIPSGLATGNDYKIRITSTTNPAISDTSNSNFTITGSIVVTYPNGGESWIRSTTPTITWTSSGIVGTHVKIELLKAGTVLTLASGTPNDGSSSWTIPSGLTTGTDCRIRITSTINPAISDTSNSNFTIK
jgi:hypothetical protein